jgi:hypothetical protein
MCSTASCAPPVLGHSTVFGLRAAHGITTVRIGVLIQRQVSGAGPDQVVSELGRRLDVRPDTIDIGWRFMHESPTRDEALAEMQAHLDQVEPGWAALIRLEAVG